MTSIISSLIAIVAVLFSAVIHYRSSAKEAKNERDIQVRVNEHERKVREIQDHVQNAIDENDSSSDVYIAERMREYDRANNNKD